MSKVKRKIIPIEAQISRNFFSPVSKEIKYKGVTISTLFPSGYYEFYSDREQRFLKFDILQDAKDRIKEEAEN